MCNAQCLDFVRASASADVVKGRRVLEVGALDVNGTPRSSLEELGPASYVGIDLVQGPGVDIVCPAEKIIEQFGRNSFDMVVTTEMIEHVGDWRRVISNLKQVLTSNGLLILTTRSLGFPQHDYPSDFWRFEPSDMRVIFSDFEIVSIEQDEPESPGVFVAARRPEAFEEISLDGHALYSMICERRVITVEQAEEWQAAQSQVEDLRLEFEVALARIQELESSLDESRLNREQLEQDGRRLEEERAKLEEELRALRSTRTFRYTAGLRELYTNVRSAHARKFTS